MLNSLFDARTAREIHKIRIPLLSTRKYLWTHSPSCLFTAKSAYALISKTRTSIASSPLFPSQWKSLWKLNLVDRLKLFLWKIAWDIIPTKSRINKVFPIPPTELACPLCKTGEDSLQHLFFSCFFSRISWRSSHWPLNSVQWSELSMYEWISGILTPNLSFGIPKDDTHLFQIYAVILCDMMWFSRNQAIHKGVLLEVSSFVATIKRPSLDHFTAWQSKSQPMVESWSSPAAGSFKVNFDTAIRDLFSIQAAIWRDEKGSIISSYYQYNPL
jgi:hypothetical protein